MQYHLNRSSLVFPNKGFTIATVSIVWGVQSEGLFWAGSLISVRIVYTGFLLPSVVSALCGGATSDKRVRTGMFIYELDRGRRRRKVGRKGEWQNWAR